ncbi:MAG: ABC transporter permease subunit [bacterium]|nr:ABC transporter permease subunit [bacterium]
MAVSHVRHIENPRDKILPTISQMGDAVYYMAFKEDTNTGKYLMLNDALSSLRRLLIGMALASMLGLLLGLNMGLYPGFEGLSSVFITVISIIPPLAILPILFIAFGVDELAKIMLIFLGTFPLICRDIYLYTKKTPQEQITKSLTLGASQIQATYRIIMPQVIPRLIDTTRLSFGAAWLFLIASEAIASPDGLGYRIFLVRRYLAMDIIIPYVFLITILGFSIDWFLKKLVVWKYSWYLEAKS